MTLPELPERDPGVPRFVWLGLALALALGLWTLLRPPIELDGRPLEAPETGIEPGQDLAAAGARLYVAQGCGECHVTVGPDNVLGPSLQGLRERAEARLASPDYQGAASSIEAYVAEASLQHCLDPLPGWDCPELSELALRLSLAEGEALAAFLLPAAEEDAP